MGSVLSKPSWVSSPRFIPITRFAYVHLLRILLLRTHLQDTVAVRDKIDSLRSRITVLEPLFAAPAGDVAEGKRRNELLWYVIVLHPDPALIPFQ